MFRIFIALCSFFLIGVNSETINQLSYCNGNKLGLVIVSTLDGKLSALSSLGKLQWQLDTGPGPLLISNIHNLELTNNGEYIRIIPSLSGTLYKFDGKTIDPIQISVDSLLKSSFRYSDDLVIAGGVEVRTYGIGFYSGKLFYECTPSKCTNEDNTDVVEDVLLIERTTQTIRAVEPRSGSERWNFSVGLNDIKLPQLSCLEKTNLFDWNITTILPEGKIHASKIFDKIEKTWKYKFDAPIVRVWRWNGQNLDEINLFAPRTVPKLIFDSAENQLTFAIYVGMHDYQLYVHESVVMQNILQGKASTDIVVRDTNSLVKIPWNPVPASDKKTDGIDDIEEEDSTAVSVLHASKSFNGSGYYLSIETELNKQQMCDKNNTIKNEIETKTMTREYVEYFLGFQLEIMLVIGTTLICNFIYRWWSTNNSRITNNEQTNDSNTQDTERRISETSEQPFQSRYINDFDIIRCLGKGGFGVVFEVKQKFDEGSYAIKRIALSNKKNSRNRVMREVKVLARLDHQNIVRYFGSWEERPSPDWCAEHDQKWLKDISATTTYPSQETSPSMSVKSRRNKSNSISINMDSLKFPLDDKEGGYSFIEFAYEEDDPYLNDENEENKTVDDSEEDNSVSTSEYLVSEHEMKKINWRRPSRKHHSWDLTQSRVNNLKIEPPVFLYIQMQLCKKESLKEWLQENLKRDYSDILNMFKQILSAVEYVHLRGLIHRDLKPSNILFSLDGQIKVADFGLVKAMQEPCNGDKQQWKYNNNHSVNVGTMLYMSPEQFNNGKYDYKVDIYSLGLIFFELLVPFATESERVKVLTNIKKHDYPKGFKEKYPNEFALIDNMLNKVPEKRLTTIGIKVRPPCNMKDSQYSEEYHYSLPKL